MAPGQAVSHVDLQRAWLQATAPGGGIHTDRVLCRAADLSSPGSGRPLGSRRRDSSLPEQGLAFEAACITATRGRGTPGPDRQFVLHRCGAAREMTATQPADPHMLDGSREAGYPLTGAANWLWLAPRAGRSRALVIGEIPPLYKRGLSANFEQVDGVPVTSLHDAATLDSKGNHRANLVYEDASVDCVVSTDLVNAWRAWRRSPFQDLRLVAALTGLHRLLTPGGLLFLSGPNARWYQALLRRGAVESSRFVRSGHPGPLLHLGQARNALARAGFSETRAYFVERSVGDAVVPASRRATM